MDPHSYNLLQSYFNDGNNKYHYDSLQSGQNFFQLYFTRTVTLSGIAITIDLIKPVGFGPNPTAEDIQFLTTEVEEFQGIPLNGDECVTLGWTYLGNTKDNADNIAAAKVECDAKGHVFRSLYYQSGYFVFGCVEDKLFFDRYS